MKKKTIQKLLLGTGTLILLFYVVTVIYPNYIGVPIAAYNSQQAWADYDKELEGKFDSIPAFPKPVGLVNDFEQIFTAEQRISLEKRLVEYEQRTTREIAVVTVASIKPYENIVDFATDLSNEWGIGKKETNNGLSIIFSKSLKQIRISTGLGTQKILTDSICKSIIAQTIIPELKNGNHYTGIEKGIAELIKKWK